MKITVDGKEKRKKKTFPPEIGVLNFLDPAPSVAIRRVRKTPGQISR